MKSRITKLIEKMDALNNALQKEYQNMAEKYGFKLQNRKVIFFSLFKERNKKWKIPTWKYVIPRDIKHFISMPFIYSMIIPAVILDIFLSVYHAVAFPLYGIPKVKRREYIVYDRKFLDYLNIIQKVHCLYCSYVNGLFAYAGEIAARTERYWCPIKAANKPVAHHTWYSEFADYGNPEQWERKFNDQTAFNGICKDPKEK